MQPHQQTSPNCCQANSCTYNLVTLAEWLDGTAQRHEVTADKTSAAAAPKPLPLVDLRTQYEYNTHRIIVPPSSNVTHQTPIIVNLPLSTLLSGERSCELPPRHVEFAILVPREYISSFSNEEATSSHSCDECNIREFFTATKSKSTDQTRKPWLVRQILLENEEFWIDARRLELLVERKASCVAGDDLLSSNNLFCKLPRLWKPDPLVCSDVLSMLKNKIQQHNNGNDTTSFTGIVLDLGSGAGRDICFLAEELKEWHSNNTYALTPSTEDDIPSDDTIKPQFPIQFIGIDNHKGSAKRCLPLWKYRGVQDITSSVHLNLEKLNEVNVFLSSIISPTFAADTFLCIYAIRYLNRKLLSYLAYAASNSIQQTNNDDQDTTSQCQSSNAQYTSIQLPKGTIIAISHFCKPSSSTKWEFDHPKESQVLNRWELRDLFGSVTCYTDIDDGGEKRSCWKIVKDEICLDGDHGRTLIQFVVVKIV
jgi:hypothetical protein